MIKAVAYRGLGSWFSNSTEKSLNFDRWHFVTASLALALYTVVQIIKILIGIGTSKIA
ncbi:MAG: hypothetical protein WBB43_02100 [Limnoraphis sp.]